MPWWWRRVFNSRPINWRAYLKCTHKCMEIFKLSKLSNFICIHLILFSDFHFLPLELVVFAYTGHQALFKMMIIVSENVRNEWLECVISSFSDIFFLLRTSSLASLFCCKMIILNGLVDAGRSCRICWPLRRERERRIEYSYDLLTNSFELNYTLRSPHDTQYEICVFIPSLHLVIRSNVSRLDLFSSKLGSFGVFSLLLSTVLKSSVLCEHK